LLLGLVELERQFLSVLNLSAKKNSKGGALD
jgi:hypothetical protein